jgi:hypothetical protein
VLKELEESGIDREKGKKILEFIEIKGTNDEIIQALKDLNIDEETFNQGLDEMSELISCIKAYNIDEKNYRIDLKIARGLDYYTGTVYETTLDDYPKIGSVCSGGRYDNLASYYTEKTLPGVGISIGLSRLFYQLEQAKIISAEDKSLIDIIILPMDGFIHEGIKLLAKLREKNVKVTIYSEDAKLGKKFKYADQIKVPYAIVLGENEVKNGLYSLRNMATGEQEEVDFNKLVEKFSK